jgi:hypothetical protein
MVQIIWIYKTNFGMYRVERQIVQIIHWSTKSEVMKQHEQHY